jgi:hypothetical protein
MYMQCHFWEIADCMSTYILNIYFKMNQNWTQLSISKVFTGTNDLILSHYLNLAYISILTSLTVG